MAIFWFLKMADVRNLGFSKIQNFNCRCGLYGQLVNMLHPAKFHADTSNRYCRDVNDFAIFQNGGHLPS